MLHEMLAGSGTILLYFAIAVLAVVTLRFIVRIPDELFRKLLHFVLLGSLLVWTLAFERWWLAALSAVGFALLVYPLLVLAEHLRGYSAFVTERSSGELKRSLLVVFSMYALVVAVMCLSGAVMVLVALLGGSGDKGNVIPSLIVALLGLIANTLFWRKYTRLNRQAPNAIIAVQARLYRAKSLVDGCVTLALAAVALSPASPVAAWLDVGGTVVVAVYLVWCGLRTIRECADTTA